MTLNFLPKKDAAGVLSPKQLLHKALGGYEKARSLANVHASELTKLEPLCPRFYALCDELGKPGKDRWLNASDIVTFDMGSDLQERVAHYFADMDRAVGHWRCASCKVDQEFCKRPLKCLKCGCRLFKPVEVRFVSAVSGASCGVDLLLNMDLPKLVPIEIKTMKKEELVSLIAPLAEHRLRTNLYLRIIAESSHSWASFVGTQHAWVLYVCKAGFFSDEESRKWNVYDKFSPFKNYLIQRQDKHTDDHSLRARVVKEYREGSIKMPVGICSSVMSKRAQSCARKAECFSGKYPGVHVWQGVKT